MNSKILIGLVVLIAGIGIGWYVLNGNSVTNQPSANPTPTPDAYVAPATDSGLTGLEATGSAGAMEKGGVPSSNDVVVTAQANVSYTDNGFSPKSITVKKGTAVTFTNQAARGMWVASAVHPTHQLLPGFDQLKSVEKSGIYTYTFVKVGTWQYHNHVNATDTGAVIVTE